MADDIDWLEQRRISEGVSGHSNCQLKHRHYQTYCCPVCRAKWGDLPRKALTTPWGAFSEHRKANWDLEEWALYDQEIAEARVYEQNWTLENCQHDLCRITDDNREICDRCNKDVTSADAPIEAFETARARLAEIEAAED